MIARDFQPFSIYIEDEGNLDRWYQLPSRKHFSVQATPKMYTELTKKVSTVVKSTMTLALKPIVEHHALTTPTLISLHTLSISSRQMVAIDMFQMCERHTAQNLLSKILSILEAWMIDEKRVTC